VEADRLNAEASRMFDEGTAARETADKYVRDTVLFASVLFLVAIANGSRSGRSCRDERDRARSPRVRDHLRCRPAQALTLA
jgi:hypothetical protein